jgi:hypothetical protein
MYEGTLKTINIRRYEREFRVFISSSQAPVRGLSAIGAAKGDAHMSPRAALRSKEKKTLILEIDNGHAD